MLCLGGALMELPGNAVGGVHEGCIGMCQPDDRKTWVVSIEEGECARHQECNLPWMRIEVWENGSPTGKLIEAPLFVWGLLMGHVQKAYEHATMEWCGVPEADDAQFPEVDA